MHEVGDNRVFADANLPGEFAEDEIGVGVGRLEMLVDFAKVVRCGEFDDRELLADADVIPMAVVFRKIAKAFVRIE